MILIEGAITSGEATLTVVFDAASGATPVEPGPAGTVISETPATDGRPWLSFADLLVPASAERAIELLVDLNSLKDDEGRLLSTAVRHGELDTWWCHQQSVLDLYLVPFVRYQPLLELCARAAGVTIHGCPPALARLLPLVLPPGRVELVPGAPAGPSLLPLRRLATKLIYGSTTLAAVAAQLVHPGDYLVYTYDATDDAGRNRWISGLHDALRRRGSRFVEIVWSDSGRRALDSLRGRRRSVLVWQWLAPRSAPDAVVRRSQALSPVADLRDQFLRSIADTVMLPAARASLRTVRRLAWWLRLLKPRGVFLMDDPVHVWELVIACRSAGIPTVAVQHGQFSRATAGLMGYGYHGSERLSFDRYCLWSDFFRDLLTRHSRLIPAASIVVTGRPRTGGRPPPGAVSSRRVVVLGELGPPEFRREMDAYVRALLEAGLEVSVRPHPQEGRVPAPTAPPGGREPGVAAGPIEEVLASAAVVVASFSSAIFDAILHEVPVVLAATALYTDPHGLASAGVTALAMSPGQVVDHVRSAMQLPPQELARRREVVWGGAIVDDGGAAALRVMEALSGRCES